MATFNELELKDLHDLLQLREAVFIVEQDCIYHDVDGKDFKALHIMGFHEQKLVAYARGFKAGDYFDECAIGRVVVDKKYRSHGYGKQIMEASIKAIQDQFGCTTIALSAQTYLVDFYKDLKFTPIGEEYPEDGIPHIKMVKN